MKNDTLQTILEHKLQSAPLCDSGAECLWCTKEIVFLGDHKHPCLDCADERKSYIQECLLEWDLIVARAGASTCADTRKQVVDALQGFAAGWAVRIKEIMEGVE